jgi:hypothetical protein
VQKAAEMRKKVYELLKKSKAEKLLSYSIKKISDRISQISEFGLEKELPKIKMNEWTKIKK